MTPLLAIPIVILLLAALLAALNYHSLAKDRLCSVEYLLEANDRLKTAASEARREMRGYFNSAEDASKDKYKAERLYKETLESLTVAQKGLDVQQAELESLREQSEVWDDMKAQLQDEVQRLQGELNRKNKEMVELRRERTISTGKIANLKDRLDKVDEQLAVKDRLIQGSRDANRRLRAKLTTIRECIDETQADA